MIENPDADLTRLAPDNDVVVTREELHQPALLRYAPGADGRQRHVAVELRIAPISHGRHVGEPGIEIWLDGRRVGELTALMSSRYGPLVADMLRNGQRPGAEAHVGNGGRGIEVTVRLPDVPTGAPATPPLIPPTPGPAAPRPRRRAGKPLLIGAGVVVGLLVINSMFSDRGAPTTPTAATPVATAPPTAPATAPQPPAVAEQTVAAAPALAAASAAVTTSPPKPVPQTQPPTFQPAPQPPAPRPPVVEPPAAKPPVAPPPVAKPTGGCDPNYSGCVPVASDVDCQGGSGNGPAYVKGPVNVTGSDIYGLDNDHDGIGCE